MKDNYLDKVDNIILVLLAKDENIQKIAITTGKSRKTIFCRLKAIRKKFSCKTNTGLISLLCRKNYISDPYLTKWEKVVDAIR